MRYVYSELWSKGGKPRIPMSYRHNERQETEAQHWEKMTNYLFISYIKINDGNFSWFCFTEGNDDFTGCERENDRMRQLILLVLVRWLVVLPLHQNLFLLYSHVRNEQFMVINWPDGPIKRDFVGNHIGRNDTIRTASTNERSNRWKTRTVWQMRKRLPLKTINKERETATNLCVRFLVLCNKLPTFSNAVNF